jgi:hypothetical protein
MHAPLSKMLSDVDDTDKLRYFLFRTPEQSWRPTASLEHPDIAKKGLTNPRQIPLGQNHAAAAKFGAKECGGFW